MIRLEKINGKNVRDILKLRVSEAQKSFVAPNAASIIEAYIAVTHHGQAFPFGIYEEDTPVGFCMVGFGTDDDWADAPAVARGSYNLWRFMIDEQYQGKGYGKAAMRKVLDFISAEPCGPAERCWVSYEPENEAAKALYASFGFRETGDLDGDEVIAVLELGTDQNSVSVRYVTEADQEFWFSLDRHLSREEFSRKARDRMGYVLTAGNQPAAILRYSLFWDSIPFCTLLYVQENSRHRGYGRMLMRYWEEDMKKKGHGLVLTSTQEDEDAQYFYRAIGYLDCGELNLPFPGYEQPRELILGKGL